jgi:hypothetical protein
MTEESRAKLIAAGRQDLVDSYELLQSGYAGINQNGTIVDRRLFPEAIEIPFNPIFDTPPPKKI